MGVRASLHRSSCLFTSESVPMYCRVRAYLYRSLCLGFVPLYIGVRAYLDRSSCLCISELALVYMGVRAHRRVRAEFVPKFALSCVLILI
jgi:hypothetical protein